jgi:hypothetical protein
MRDDVIEEWPQNLAYQGLIGVDIEHQNIEPCSKAA